MALLRVYLCVDVNNSTRLGGCDRLRNAVNRSGCYALSCLYTTINFSLKQDLNLKACNRQILLSSTEVSELIWSTVEKLVKFAFFCRKRLFIYWLFKSQNIMGLAQL